MNSKKHTTNTRISGTTLLEMMFTIAIFSIVMLAIYMGVSTTTDMFATSSTALGLEQSGRKALYTMCQELRAAGITDHPSYPGNPQYAYPYVFNDNNPQGPYLSHKLSTGELPLDNIDTEMPGDIAIGSNSTIVFKTPITDAGTLTDDSGNPIPVYKNGSEIEVKWGGRVRTDSAQSAHGVTTDGIAANEISFVLVRAPDGQSNNLERRESATGEKTVICRYVERVVFEYYMLGGVQQQNQIRIKLFLRRRDDANNWISADVSAVIAMRSIKQDL